jgi:hypothetical protein
MLAAIRQADSAVSHAKNSVILLKLFHKKNLLLKGWFKELELVVGRTSFMYLGKIVKSIKQR